MYLDTRRMSFDNVRGGAVRRRTARLDGAEPKEAIRAAQRRRFLLDYLGMAYTGHRRPRREPGRRCSCANRGIDGRPERNHARRASSRSTQQHPREAQRRSPMAHLASPRSQPLCASSCSQYQGGDPRSSHRGARAPRPTTSSQTTASRRRTAIVLAGRRRLKPDRRRDLDRRPGRMKSRCRRTSSRRRARSRRGASRSRLRARSLQFGLRREVLEGGAVSRRMLDGLDVGPS